MKKYLIMLVSVVAAASVSANYTVVSETFSDPDDIAVAGNPNCSIVAMPDGSGNALLVDAPELPEKRYAYFRKDLPVDEFAGEKIRCSIEVKAEDIAKSDKHFHGGKFSLLVKAPGKDTWPGQDMGFGSFDWRPVIFTTEIPYGATGITLHLGLQGVTGKIYFRNLKVEVLDDTPRKEPENAVFYNPLDESLKIPASKDFASIALVDGQPALRVAVKPDDDIRASHTVSVTLPAEKIAGKKVKIKAMTKSDEIGEPDKHFLGGKFMVIYRKAGADKGDYAEKTILRGQYDWKPVEYIWDVPADLQSAGILMGLQGCSGTIYYKDLVIEEVQ